MTTPGLFVVGALVTLIVAAALALLTYGAILDGRYATARKLEHEEDMREQAQTKSPPATAPAQAKTTTMPAKTTPAPAKTTPAPAKTTPAPANAAPAQAKTASAPADPVPVVAA